MRIISGEAALGVWEGKSPVVALGMFDGVHKGHRALIRRAVTDAREAGTESVVFTFDPHPLEVLAPSQFPRLLTTTDEKARLVDQLGADAMLLCPFTAEFAATAPEDFVQSVLVGRLHAREVVVGYNFTFGAAGRGNRRLLAGLAESAGFRLVVIPPISSGRRAVSSTSARSALERGDVAEAAKILGYPYAVSGPVEHGAGRGRGLGFPTVNVRFEAKKMLPGDGVYVVSVETRSGSYLGIAAISNQPTFNGEWRTLEAHLLDFQDDLYDQEVAVRFHERLRGISAFRDAGELRAQIEEDAAAARRWLTRHSLQEKGSMVL